MRARDAVRMRGGGSSPRISSSAAACVAHAVAFGRQALAFSHQWQQPGLSEASHIILKVLALQFVKPGAALGQGDGPAVAATAAAAAAGGVRRCAVSFLAKPYS